MDIRFVVGLDNCHIIFRLRRPSSMINAFDEDSRVKHMRDWYRSVQQLNEILPEQIREHGTVLVFDDVVNDFANRSYKVVAQCDVNCRLPIVVIVEDRIHDVEELLVLVSKKVVHRLLLTNQVCNNRSLIQFETRLIEMTGRRLLNDEVINILFTR